MPLKHPQSSNASMSRDLSLPPVFALEGKRVPRHTLPAGERPPEVLISDIKRKLGVLDKQSAAVHTSDNSTSFHH